MTDPIADLLTRIRNAYLAKKETVEVPHSHTKEAIVKILKQGGYIDSVKVVKQSPQPKIVLTLAYKGKVPALEGIERVSKPGRRMYVKANKIPLTLGGYGITILSTNQGVITDKEAKKKNLGGEIICKVW
jgi:small subunit ribosomal protein S8